MTPLRMSEQTTIAPRSESDAARRARVLVVEDDPSFREAVCGTLRAEGYDTAEAGEGREALGVLAADPIDLVLLDLRLGHSRLSGMEVLREATTAYPDVPVVMVSGAGSISVAVEATQLGAYDFLEKPVNRERLLLTVRNALEKARLQRERNRLLDEVEEPYRMVGSSAAMRAVYGLVGRAARTESRVLITGESGVGKELVARAIHRQSARAAGPFFVLDCGTLSQDLIESELFGHEEGAYTGAKGARRGRFEQADGGTLFLDEVGNMGLSAQARFLRVLETGEVTPLGGEDVRRVDVRLITAYNRDLGAAVAAGTFREDLYFRLDVLRIHVPPLRERSEDVPALIEHALRRLSERRGLPLKAFTPEALALMAGHDWPGNIRELQNAVERLSVLCDGSAITADDVAAELDDARPAVRASAPPPSARPIVPLADALGDYERRTLVQALVAHDWNRQETAAALGIDRTQLWRKMKQHGIEAPGRPGAHGSDT